MQVFIRCLRLYNSLDKDANFDIFFNHFITKSVKLRTLLYDVSRNMFYHCTTVTILFLSNDPIV